MRFLLSIFDARRCHAPSRTTCKLGKNMKAVMHVSWDIVKSLIVFILEPWQSNIQPLIYFCFFFIQKSDTVGNQKHSQITIHRNMQHDFILLFLRTFPSERTDFVRWRLPLHRNLRMSFWNSAGGFFAPHFFPFPNIAQPPPPHPLYLGKDQN